MVSHWQENVSSKGAVGRFRQGKNLTPSKQALGLGWLLFYGLIKSEFGLHTRNTASTIAFAMLARATGNYLTGRIEMNLVPTNMT